MLTFEEFFQKKKINLLQFQAAEPGLFAEFFSHYPLMGEKSFDHTKKYWFNNLRRNYPLTEAVKPHAVQAEAISPLAVQGVAVAAAQNIEAGLERPKFTEDNLLDLVDENVLQSEVSLIEEEKIINATEPEIPVTKPAFKPRFNAKNIKKPEVEEVDSEKGAEENSEERKPETEPAKPAFKPRFNIQNIKKDVVKEASETEIQKPETEEKKIETKESEERKPEIQSESTTENPQPAIDKPYKPRFQMKNMPKPPSDQA